MQEFAYVSQNSEGRIGRGRLAAETAAGLRSLLQSRGERLLSFKTLTGDRSGQQLQISNPLDRLPPRSQTVETSMEQLAVMLRSGVGLLEGLRIVSEQSTSKSLRRICERLSENIQEGTSLSEAMQQERCFPAIAVQLVRVGETTGNLDLVLVRAAAQMRSRRQNFSNVITAVAYPLVVGIAAIGVATYLVLFVIPELQKFLTSIGRKLPAMTQSLIDLSAWIQVNGPKAAVLLIAAIVAVVLVYRWPPGRMAFDRYSLRIPVLGTVFRLAGTVAFSSALGVMVRSGITVLEALRTIEQLHGNRYLASRVAAAREVVLEGGDLSKPLAEKHAYMPMLSSMVGVAENTGQMDEVLEQVTVFHEERLQVAIKRLGALIEPATIVLVGGIVGYVYMAFFMALFSAGG